MASYCERTACDGLADLIVCTWIDPPAEERHPVLPDACIDLVWDGAELRVAGPNTRPFMVAGQATFVGIRFRPGAAPGLLEVPASDLLDQNVALRDLWGRTADELAEHLADSDLAHAPRLLEDAILARRNVSAAAPDPLITALLADLSQSCGAARGLPRLTERLGISERTVRRRCVSAIGYGPKMVDRVLRFRRVVRLIHARMPLAAAAHLAGYADQAHLTRELQQLGGLTPRQLRGQPGVAISGNGYT
jgi:AraC-like DNA-binding protein